MGIDSSGCTALELCGQPVHAEDVMATLEKFGELKARGILTPQEFDEKKAELLKKRV